MHPAVLLADSLLEQGAIGRVRTARGETTYQADSDALFRGWPIAVLVDANTSGTAEWLAAALQDNHRAVDRRDVDPRRHRERGRRWAEMPGSRRESGRESPSATVRWSIELTTGYLERGDGRALAAPTRTRPTPLGRSRSTRDEPRRSRPGSNRIMWSPPDPAQPIARGQGPGAGATGPGPGEAAGTHLSQDP